MMRDGYKSALIYRQIHNAISDYYIWKKNSMEKIVGISLRKKNQLRMDLGKIFLYPTAPISATSMTSCDDVSFGPIYSYGL